MLKTIPFNQLCKAAYNRPVDRTHVNTIKRKFNPNLKNPVVASFRDEAYWIIDHQHQAQAEYELNGCDPNTPIECDVLFGLTYEQEAELYYDLNTSSRPLKFVDKIIGKIEAKDENALRFHNIVESCGYVLGGNANNSLRAVSFAWKIFNKANGDEKLKRILTLTYDCWPNSKDGAQKPLIEGLLLFMQYHGDEFKRDHFIKVFSMADPCEIVRQAKTFFHQMDRRSFTQPYCTYAILVNTYNIGLQNKLEKMPPQI